MGFCIPKPCRYFNVAPNCIRGSGNHLSGSPRSQRKTKESCILVSMPQILPEEEIADQACNDDALFFGIFILQLRRSAICIAPGFNPG
jgi:hypothetical protein